MIRKIIVIISLTVITLTLIFILTDFMMRIMLREKGGIPTQDRVLIGTPNAQQGVKNQSTSKESTSEKLRATVFNAEKDVYGWYIRTDLSGRGLLTVVL